ncbi:MULTISPECIES: amino-acid N-acetyltransferase [unclassified Streptomyces]|uniref:amino-acid N-acetyltransferase n=1 Tax=unclassified Streptomyces TaxID=2593676 RepID=UPI0035E11502
MSSEQSKAEHGSASQTRTHTGPETRSRADVHTGPSVNKPAITVRRARTSDVASVRGLLDGYVSQGILLDKATVTLYEDIQEFWVAERDEDGRVIGCGALHVMWEDLAEVRTLAVDLSVKGTGVGHQVLDKLLQTARWLGVRRVFCLTFEVDFFAAHGFTEIGETPVDGDVFSELLRSYDEGVAEFLGLERVKPNTLGNSRMLLHL